MEANPSTQRVIPGKENGMPDPYGKGFHGVTDPLEKSKTDWISAETQRVKFGKIASSNPVLLLRRTTGILMAIGALAAVIAPTHAFTHPSLFVLLWIPMLLVSIGSALVAGERAWSAMSLRAALWKQGMVIPNVNRDIMSEPGMDRIREGLIDARRHNYIASILAALSVFMLISAAGMSTDGLAYNLLLLIAMATSLGLAFHSIFITDEIKRLGDRLPFLSLHSPTHHPTKLDTILGDIVFAHLDPDISQEWIMWEQKLSRSILPGNESTQARERILYLLYLHVEGELSTEETIAELKEFIQPMAIEDLLFDEESEFNWRRLQRLIKHAKAWRPEVFEVLERLQSNLLSGTTSITHNEWRMDIALAQMCDDGTGHLFIALNNQTTRNRNMRVEVIVPGGTPEIQKHRFELSPCPGPKTPLPLTNSLTEDVLDWMPKYLEKGIILWIGVAWKRGMRGIKNVQVILRDDDGCVLDSRVIQTEKATLINSATGSRIKQILNARSIGESPLPSKETLSI
ncbi:MAG: hypothetical protein QGG96_03945 [Candidatus Poseidoniaceae archaeon]|jgi:hypothetical protein|nr:hypothetical protein [Candidatus Poseidoniaceae archaeon]